jgi:hypothetical protein
MKRFAWIGIVAGLAAAAPALVIDPFTDVQTIARTTQGTTTETVAGAMVGGSRRTSQTLLAGIGGVPISATTRVLDGWLDHASSSYSITALALTYGRNGTAGSLNLDWSAFDRFTLSFWYNDLAPTNVTIRVESNDGANSSELTQVVPVVNNPSHLVTWTFANFVGDANFADVDSVRITFSPQEAGDFLVRDFQVVPEPATMAALAIGVGALLARRRRSSGA